jgi:hypothetical protein
MFKAICNDLYFSSLEEVMSYQRIYFLLYRKQPAYRIISK